jgi:hypothetical protein
MHAVVENVDGVMPTNRIGHFGMTGVPDSAFQACLVPNLVPNRPGNRLRCRRHRVRDPVQQIAQRRPRLGIQRESYRSVVAGFARPSLGTLSDRSRRTATNSSMSSSRIAGETIRAVTSFAACPRCPGRTARARFQAGPGGGPTAALSTLRRERRRAEARKDHVGGQVRQGRTRWPRAPARAPAMLESRR